MWTIGLRVNGQCSRSRLSDETALLTKRLRACVVERREAQALADFIAIRHDVDSIVLVARDGAWCAEGIRGVALLRGEMFGSDFSSMLSVASGETWSVMDIHHGRRLVALLATSSSVDCAQSVAACAAAAPFLAAICARKAPRDGIAAAKHPTSLPLCSSPIAIGSMMMELVKDLDQGSRLELRLLGDPIVAGDGRSLRLALGGVIHSALHAIGYAGFVTIAVGECGSRVFIEMSGKQRDSDKEGPLPPMGGDVTEHLTLAVARAVLRAHGGTLRIDEDIRRLIVAYLPRAVVV